MSLLGRALSGVERRSTSTLGNPSAELYDALTMGATYGGRAVTVDSSLRLIPVFSAIQLLSGAVGSLPLMVYRRLETGRERATDHWMWKLLHEQPNQWMSADEVWALVTAHLYTWGNAFLGKVKTPGSPYPVDELIPLRPDRVVVGVEKDGTRYFILDGRDRYTEADILHIRGFGTDGLVGLSPIQQARQALGMVGDMEEFSGRFWGSGAVSAVVLKHPNRLTPLAHENLRTSVKAKLGAAGGGDPWVLEEGMDVSTLTMPLDDAQFIEQRRMNLLDIALLFRVPPKMLGAATGDSLTYTSSEWEGLDFIRWSLRPTLVRIESSLKRDLDLFIQGRRFYPEFLVDALMRGTSQERAEFYAKALDPVLGWMNRGEVRDLENLTPESKPAAPPVLAPLPQLPVSVNGRKA